MAFTFAGIRRPEQPELRELRPLWVSDCITDPQLSDLMFAVLRARLEQLAMVYQIVELAASGCRLELLTSEPQVCVTVDVLWVPEQGEWMSASHPSLRSDPVARAGLAALLAPWERTSVFFRSVSGGRLLGDGVPTGGTGFVSTSVSAALPARAAPRARSRTPRRPPARQVRLERSPAPRRGRR